MAVAYASHSTVAFATVSADTSITITKPTGLAVGDIMVAHLSAIVAAGTNSNWQESGSDGFTILLNQNNASDSNSEARLTVMYKVADSGDVAASDFSFAVDESLAVDFLGAGAIYRITGGVTTAGATAAGSTTTPTFVNTVTPLADSLLLFLTTCADASQTTGSASSYAITTSNPTWTERYDFTGDIDTRRGIMAGATASRPEATATGNSTLTFVNYAQNAIGAIVHINPTINATVTPDVMVVAVSAPDPVIGVTSFPAVMSIASSIPTPTATVIANPATNVNKSSTSTMTNVNKSATSTMTNVNKSATSTVTNVNKT